MADKVTKALTGEGIWGVEFFIAGSDIYFSELSPRPHDTGMVTLAGTQNFNEFELHLRAVLGLEIPEITLERSAASAVILAESDSSRVPVYTGIEEAVKYPESDIKIFGKPNTRKYRRMGVALAYGKAGSDVNDLRKRAEEIAGKIKVM